MRAVNLLPADRRTQKGGVPIGEAPRKPLLVACAALGVVTVAGLSTAVWSTNSSVSGKKKQLEALQTQISSIPAPGAGTSSDTSARAVAIQGIVGNRLVWNNFLQTLSKVTPEDVWLQNLQVTTAGAAATLAEAQAAAAAAAAAAETTTTTSSGGAASATSTASAPAPAVSNTFTISGFTYSQPSVARLMRRLDIVPWLQDVSLVSSSKGMIGNDTVFQFTLKAAVVPTPGSGA